MLPFKVPAISRADGVLVVGAPLHQLPVFAPQQPAIPKAYHFVPKDLQAMGDLRSDMLVRQDAERHRDDYPAAGADASPRA
jgi:hypothetical protein